MKITREWRDKVETITGNKTNCDLSALTRRLSGSFFWEVDSSLCLSRSCIYKWTADYNTELCSTKQTTFSPTKSTNQDYRARLNNLWECISVINRTDMLLCGLGYYCNRYWLKNKLKDQALREIKDDTEKRLTWTRELLSMLSVSWTLNPDLCAVFKFNRTHTFLKEGSETKGKTDSLISRYYQYIVK